MLYRNLVGNTITKPGMAAAVLVLILLMMSGLVSGCSAAKPGSYTPSASWCQDIADEIKSIQPVNIPGNLAQESSIKTGGEFDINEYFPVLKHLSIKNGYVLDYLYLASSSGGVPVLFTRHQDQKPYQTYNEYNKAASAITRPEDDVSLVWLTKDKNAEAKYGNQIKIDNSTEGYYEYTVFQLLGGQFYLLSKANSYDVRITCESDEIEKIMAEIASSNMAPIDENFMIAARDLDLQPVVEIGEKTATVSLVIFTKWGGFSRVSYTMNRKSPHIITGYTNENILAYDCGITL